MNLEQKIILFILFFLFIKVLPVKAGDPPFIKYLNDKWVNEQLNNLTLDEQIAQLMTITVYPRQGDEEKNKIINEIKTGKPGGILVMQGSPVKTASWINEFQENSSIPLLVAVDGEWGLSMRIDSTMIYPYAQAIGAIQDTTWIYQMGLNFGRQLQAMGIQMNFAPDADVNTNPDNPVINFRSFGEDKKNVAEKTWLVAKGMQDAGVIPVAKHFPGHGDTQTDSHKTLPLVNWPKARLDSVETYPFRYLAAKGISGIMSAHLNVPALDDSGTPSSLSKKIITDYLKNEIGFKGFVVTDAINMKGVRTQSGNAEVEALKAGNDMVEFVPDLQKAIALVKQAVANGKLSKKEIENKCRKVLALKRWANLNKYLPANLTHLTSRLNSPYYEVTTRKLIQQSLTVLTNNKTLPVEHLDTLKIASVIIGGESVSPFQKMLGEYTQIDHFILPKNASEQTWAKLRMKLQNYNLVIAGVAGIHIYPSGKYGTSEIQRNAVNDLIQENKTIVAFFGNAYALKHFTNIHHAAGLILAYQDSLLTQQLAAQLIFGAIGASGKLPVTVDKRFQLNDGIEIKKNDCLAYTIPEEVGINSAKLEHKIDSIVYLGLESAAYPGCQILITKNGNVIFHKCYGYYTYRKEQKVEPEDLYDFASVTKVTGPLPAIMKLVDKKKIDLDAPFSRYWPDFIGSNKQNLKIREILAHQARLIPYINYWQMAIDKHEHLDRHIFRHEPSGKYNVRVAPELFMNEDFRKNMFDTIRNSKLLPRKKYLYSGLSFYIFPDIIANLTGESYEKYLKENFYRPLGAYTITYNPYKSFPMKRMVPTETDDFFRKEQMQGFVHDEGAAMMGGISGNAGLFGTTNDLAKLFQMYLQKGYYGGKRYISEKTLNEFTKIQYPENKNRRGLGFDKPLIDNHKNRLEDAYPAVDASKNSFGHSGFTGTFAWADPDNQLLFIFMSNRVYPTRNNQRLYQLNIRTAIHQAIYDCIKH